jgi:hypothetical protein
MTVYSYGAQVATYYLANPLTLATQGVLKPDTPLTVGSQGVLVAVVTSPTVETNLVTGGTAGVTVALAHRATGIIVTGGAAPVTSFTDGLFVYDYKPGATNTVALSGDAQLVVRTDGKLYAEYTAIGGESISGNANINIALGYNALGGLVTGGSSITNFIPVGGYVATGGLITGGTADATFVPVTPAGLPIHKRDLRPQRHVHYYTADALREKKVISTDYGFVLKSRGIIAFTGVADTLFIPAKYQFIKSLPRLPKPELVPDSEFLNLYKEWEKRNPTTKYKYEATGGLQLTGVSKEEYFDFQNFIIMHDDELIIADIMTTDHNPFLTTSYDLKLSRQRKDDDDLLEILELF